MNNSLKRGLTLVAIYVLVLGAAVLTGIVYTGQPDISQWSQDMRNMIAGAPLGVMIAMILFGLI